LTIKCVGLPHLPGTAFPTSNFMSRVQLDARGNTIMFALEPKHVYNQSYKVLVSTLQLCLI
jgi:hypothetical protein